LFFTLLAVRSTPDQIVQLSAAPDRLPAYAAVASHHRATSALTTASAKSPSASLLIAARRVISAEAEIAPQTSSQLFPLCPVFHHAASDGPGDAAHDVMHRTTTTMRRRSIVAALRPMAKSDIARDASATGPARTPPASSRARSVRIPRFAAIPRGAI
jgi:hypothetical protein